MKLIYSRRRKYINSTAIVGTEEESELSLELIQALFTITSKRASIL